MRLGRCHITIRMTLVTIFIFATTLTAVVAIGLQFYFGQKMAKAAAVELYSMASAGVTSELHSISAINANVIDLLADNPSLLDPTAQDIQRETFLKVLEKNPLFYGAYLGHDDGSFYEVINLENSELVRRLHRAMPNDRWLEIRVSNDQEGRRRHYRYLDKNLVTRLQRSEPTDFDVRSRPWFSGAISTGGAYRTAPYLFAQLGIPGRTLAKRVQGTNTVVAVDMTLSSMSARLRENELSGQGTLYIFNNQGEVIASSEDRHDAPPQLSIPDPVLSPEEKTFIESMPVLTVSNEMNWPPYDYNQAGEPRGYSVDVIKLIASMTGLKMNFVNGLSWNELIEKFSRGEIDLLQSVLGTEQNTSLGMFGHHFARTPYALVTSEERPGISDLSQMSNQSIAIPAGWSIIPLLRERFPNVLVIEADSTLHALQLMQAGEVDAALDNEAVLRYIAKHYFLNGLKFHSNPGMGDGPLPDKLFIVVQERHRQLRAIIDKAIAAIGPEHRAYLHNTWLNVDRDEPQLISSTVPTDKLIQIANTPDLFGKLVFSPINDEEHIIYAAPVALINESGLFIGITTPLDTVISPFIDQVKLSLALIATLIFLLTPLCWFFANPIVRPVRQLAMENDKIRLRQYDKVTSVTSNIKELDDLSDTMMDMVKAIQSHELAQRKLMDSFIKLIAQAIDDKSAYTGGHCARVPELALMLADHASNSDLPSFETFSLDSDEQWREYRIAAWLHDCGKITTPEHIVDKGSKLETIYNRIHEVRMRFEVLWRDAQIDYHTALSAAPDDKQQLLKQLNNRQKKLTEDFAFVAECNVGGEFMDKQATDRLQKLARTTWQRHFDDRLGMSPIEELRLPSTTASLPTTEHLLSDKPEHIIPRTSSTDYDPALGINMDIPEHLYNLGEIHNLSISRGTLTNEDRFKINEHMISTIKMLDSLPFPPELQNVPRYASTHHETMRGSGYPRKLSGDQLSIPERILAVADVFEALTASDRPYKKAKPISVALDILHKMVLDNHIDKDCFELFIRNEVYLQYANEFLPKEQNDTVDTSKYLDIEKC